MTVHLLPDVGRIEGLVSEIADRSDPAKGRVRLQYTDRTGSWQELQLPVLDALYLLNMLEQWSKDEQLDHLRRPPGSPT